MRWLEERSFHPDRCMERALSANRAPKTMKAPTPESGLFSLFSISLDFPDLPEENSAKLRLAERRVSLVGAGCTSHHHFVADQFSMARKFSSSTPTSALATCARASYAVAASKSMRLAASRRRDLWDDPSPT